MEDLVESLTRGNVTEVKVVLASVVLALAVYQLVLISVGYGKLRPRFLGAGPASAAHRASGAAIVVLSVVVAVICVSVYGFELGDETLHLLAGTGLLLALAFKVSLVRRWHALGRFLPAIGITVFLLFALTWASSAGDFLADR